MKSRLIWLIFLMAGGLFAAWVALADPSFPPTFAAYHAGGVPYWGGPITETVKLLAPDGAAMDQFGASVVLEGELLAVGATDDDDGGFSSGAVYLFEHSPISGTWQVITKLVATDGVPLAYFGVSIAMDGTMLAVGAPGDDGEKGAVYLFEATEPNPEWQLVLKIVAEDAEAGDNFGNAVALSGGTLAIGARSNDDLGFEAGIVYLHEKDQGGVGNWGFVKKVFSIGTSLGDYFGTSVALDGGTLVVGAVGDDVTGAQGAGTVTVFERDQGGANQWGEVNILSASDAGTDAMFGTSVVIVGDTILVGAVGADASGTDSGAAYVFDRHLGGANQWGERAKLVPADAAAFQRLGHTVTLVGDLAGLGAPENNPFQPGNGAVYLFARHTGGVDAWGEYQKLQASDGDIMDAFGLAVALQGGRLVVGAKLEDEIGDEAGAVYVFEGEVPATLTPTPTSTATPTPSLTSTPTSILTSTPTQTATPVPTYLFFLPLTVR